MGNFILVVNTLMDGVIRLYRLEVPGFDFTFLDVFIGSSVAVICLALVKTLLNRSGSTSAGTSTRNPKISEERKNDTK